MIRSRHISTGRRERAGGEYFGTWASERAMDDFFFLLLQCVCSSSMERDWRLSDPSFLPDPLMYCHIFKDKMKGSSYLVATSRKIRQSARTLRAACFCTVTATTTSRHFCFAPRVPLPRLVVTGAATRQGIRGRRGLGVDGTGCAGKCQRSSPRRWCSGRLRLSAVCGHVGKGLNARQASRATKREDCHTWGYCESGRYVCLGFNATWDDQ